MQVRRLAYALALCGAAALRLSGQVVPTFDNSGNSMLNGTSYFRELVLSPESNGIADFGIVIYGGITFDGNGNYTINAQAYDSSMSQPVSCSQYQYCHTTGTYTISSSGFGYLSSPVSTGDLVLGLVSNGAFVGSSTESQFFDMFVSAPLASPTPTVSSLKGAYAVNYIDFNSAWGGSNFYGNPYSNRSAQFVLNADGAGNFSTINATGYISNNGSAASTQSLPGIKYFYSGGAANINFGGSLTSTSLINGTKYLYMSADGNLVFGGSPTGFDFFVGTKADNSGSSFGGVYYQTGIDQDLSTASQGYVNIDSYYGSMKAGGGVLLGHQRLQSMSYNYAEDLTFSGGYTIASDGTSTDSTGYKYQYGAGGAVRIGFGHGPLISIDVALRAPTFSGPDPYINPVGVVNAASSQMFTSSLAPGELITIYGNGLAKSTAVDGTFPTTLAGVQVLVNGQPTPVYVVSPTQVSAVLPYGLNTRVTSIQINNNGTLSNRITGLTGATSPGIFTKPEGGLGSAAALHADYTLVSPASPAAPGETISVFLTGLGATSPTVADGSPGPSNPLSYINGTVYAFIGGQQASVSYAGLAPGSPAQYQINVTVPTGLSTGNVDLELIGCVTNYCPNADNLEATIPISTGVSASAVREDAAAPAPRYSRVKPQIPNLPRIARVPAWNRQ